jgi:hypothetical protein
MMASQLGAFVVQYTYKIEPGDRDDCLALLGGVRRYADEIGMAAFEVWLDDDDRTGRVTELHGYDSWSHYKRLAGREPPPDMREIYRKLEALIIGGWDGVQIRDWRPTPVPDGESAG